MQDRYAGDVGDFAKYALLTALAQQDLRLAVLWYRVGDGVKNGGGRFTQYLQNPPRFRNLAPEIFDALGQVVANERSVAAIETANVLPVGTQFISDLVPAPVRCLTPVLRTAARASRTAWFDRALAATAGSDLVFLDPDNGIEPYGGQLRPSQARSVKFALLDEIARLWRSGKSLVIYQHLDRRSSHALQAGMRRDQLRDKVGNPQPHAHAWRVPIATSRLFLVLPQPRHARQLHDRLHELQRTWQALGTSIDLCPCE